MARFEHSSTNKKVKTKKIDSRKKQVKRKNKKFDMLTSLNSLREVGMKFGHMNLSVVLVLNFIMHPFFDISPYNCHVLNYYIEAK